MLVISPVLVVAAAQPEKMLQRRVSDPQREKMPPLPSPNQGGRWSQDVDTMQSPETRTAVQCTPVFLRETKLKTGGSLADVLLIVLEYSSSSQPCI